MSVHPLQQQCAGRYAKQFWTRLSSHLCGNCFGQKSFPILTWLHQCTEQDPSSHGCESIVWMKLAGLASTEPWPQPDRTPSGWIKVETETQVTLSPSCPTSVSNLKHAVLEEWSKIPINILRVDRFHITPYGIRKEVHMWVKAREQMFLLAMYTRLHVPTA